MILENCGSQDIFELSEFSSRAKGIGSLRQKIDLLKAELEQVQIWIFYFIFLTFQY